MLQDLCLLLNDPMEEVVALHTPPIPVPSPRQC
ncbi:hypothetical protein HDF15_001443 [Granulicella mallensis]|uniref:Uncharacterized protein n=1 Tax=Granulicella mallensis TaxID=940614 RepID=A0A7W7ZNX6_9BACT|nr:hypothetical protein [Granulicella mallensis]